MRYFKAAIFFTCLSLSVFLAKAAQAEEIISIQHRVISSEPQESGSNVVMELTLTNNGTSTLSGVKITPAEISHYVLASSTLPLDVSALSAGEKLTVSWACRAAMSADYDHFLAFTRGILYLSMEAVSESGQTTIPLVPSQSIND